MGGHRTDPALPAREFALSCEFYEAMGFAASYRDAKLAIFEQDGAGFLLQDLWSEAWAAR